MRENLFKCKLFPPHEPPSHALSSPTVRIRIRSIFLSENHYFLVPIPSLLGFVNSSQSVENGDIAHFVCQSSNATDPIKWKKDGKEVKDGKEGVAIVTCSNSSHLLVAVANNGRRGRYNCIIANKVQARFELIGKDCMLTAKPQAN